ncbi:MAG: glycosyl hydrolase family 8 [Acidimicrobiales bacterium]
MVVPAMPLAAQGSASTTADPHPRATALASRDTARFFQDYVQSDGRVVRKDQGGDTVSEGQSYAMLLAVASYDRAEFAQVWAWTEGHLEQPDGLFAWHWANGAVTDRSSASDADLAIAWALSLAAARFASPTYAAAARMVAGAILTHETVQSGGGPVLVAGPWAVGDPATVDPSYFSPLAFDSLGGLTGDPRWAEMSASSLSALQQLTTSPSRLPPDWATLSRGSGAVVDSAGPDGARSPSYGLDAARAEVWYAPACQAADRAISASAWPLLAQNATNRRFPIDSTLDGQSTSTYTNALIAVADAASAEAAGAGGAAGLLATADSINSRWPTYYGSAWDALGRVLLTTHELGACAPAAGTR